MNLDEFKEILKNEELMKNIFETCLYDDFFITDKKPVYSLKECLESVNDKILESIYMNYKHIISKNKKLKDKPSKDEKINIIEREIKDSFNEYLSIITLKEKEILDEAEKNTKSDKFNITLLSNGFLFGYKENQKTVYIVPTELIDIYRKYLNSKEKKQSDLEKLDMYTHTYMLINGIIEKEFLEDIIINKYKLKVTKEEIKQAVGEYCYIYSDKYYCHEIIPYEHVELLLEIKQICPYKILEEEQILEYSNIISNLISDISKNLSKTNKDLSIKIVQDLILNYCPVDEILNQYNISKKEYKKLEEIIENIQPNIRFWNINGRTIIEFTRDQIMSNPLKSKPKNLDILSCLKLLPENIYLSINSIYNASTKEELSNMIIDNLTNCLDNYDTFELWDILYSDNVEIYDEVSTEFLANGFIYLYKEKSELKYLIPNETKEIIENYLESVDNQIVNNIVYRYIDMNGIIENTKLQQLLKENHDINISLEELDTIINNIGGVIIDKKYYTSISDITSSDAEYFIKLKEKYGKYKKADPINTELEEQFHDQLSILLENLFKDESIRDEVYNTIVISIKQGMFNEEVLNYISYDLDKEIKQSDKRKIMEIYNQYKKCISIWVYNGYSIIENLSNKQKQVKIGRNDPCPCGSGKKYKQCCGK